MTRRISTVYKDKLTVSGGSLLVADTTERDGLTGSSLAVNADSEIDVCTGFDGEGEPVDFVTDERFLWDSPLAGTLLVCPDNFYIETFKLASGNVTLNQI